ncbi:hypothetical protein ACRALDRAFT_1080525 [Sodiomyces alcalophilus JCM 7366]|uniref:uncharacterized protein n=1 Tax=Sodiomyces alcalophilus JCM 7366 TaxID=591952 RepID=UPI0039B5BEFB
MSYQMDPRTYVYGVSSPFKKRYLLPFWVIRMATMLGNFIVHAFALAFISQHRGEIERLSDEFNTLLNVDGIIAVIAVSFVLITVTLAIDIVTIVQRCRRTLTPRLFLITNSVQAVTWVVLLVLSLFGANTGSMVILGGVTLGAFIALLGYAAIIFSRERKGKIIMLKAGSVPPHMSQHQGPDSTVNYSAKVSSAESEVLSSFVTLQFAYMYLPNITMIITGSGNPQATEAGTLKGHGFYSDERHQPRDLDRGTWGV